MANSREIKGRIKSVQNTKKITRTMELVSTAKAKKAVDRVHAAQPYANKIKELIDTISSLDVDVKDPLLRKPVNKKNVGVLVITANRGLCGGFNSNVIKESLVQIKQIEEAGMNAKIYLVGKKAVSFYRFRKIDYVKGFNDLSEDPHVGESDEIANELVEGFINEDLDEIRVIYTRFFSSSLQRPVTESILPLDIEDETEKNTTETETTESEVNTDVIFEPSPEVILKSLVPRAIRVAFFQAFLDSNASEHIARRIAMKSATDAANDMIKSMKLQYNRVRQAKITQEIAEIVGGAEAL